MLTIQQRCIFLLFVTPLHSFALLHPYSTKYSRVQPPPWRPCGDAIHPYYSKEKDDDDDDDGAVEHKKKRIRRKPVNAADVNPIIPEQNDVVLENRSVTTVPPKAAEAVIQVMDVRSLVPGSSPAAASGRTLDKSTNENRGAPLKVSSSREPRAVEDDPLAQLLQDAQQMRASENRKETSEGTLSISKVLSTIVIADFFVVLVLFFWFLLGIFSSYVVHDDAIQIAFNGIFQPIVQPALGVLMIASISDAVLKKDE